MTYKNIFDWINRIDYKFEKVLTDTKKVIILHNTNSSIFGDIVELKEGNNATTIIECERGNFHFINNYDAEICQNEHQRTNHFYSEDTINRANKRLREGLRQEMIKTLEARREGCSAHYIQQCEKYDLIKDFLIAGTSQPKNSAMNKVQLECLKHNDDFNMDKFINLHKKELEKFEKANNRQRGIDLDNIKL